MSDKEIIIPGKIINLRSRFWRIDNIQEDILTATTIEGAPTVQRLFYLPLENVAPGKIEEPDPNKVGNFSAQDLLIRAYRLSKLLFGFFIF